MSKSLISEKHKKIVVAYDPKIEAIIHNSRRAQLRGRDVLAVNHGIEETKLLRNLGYEVSAPIEHYYKWSGVTPFDTQVATASMLTVNSRAFVLNDIGTGKTCSALFAFDYLRSLGLVKRMLVVAPLSTLTSVWEREVFQRFSQLTTAALFGTKKKRIQNLDSDADICIINHDGVAILQEELLAKDFDVVLLTSWLCIETLARKDGRRYVR